MVDSSGPGCSNLTYYKEVLALDCSCEIISEPLEYPAWWKCLCFCGVLSHTRWFILTMWFMLVALGHTVSVWLLEWLETKRLWLTVWALHAYVTDPPQKSWATRLRWASQVGNNSWCCHTLFAGRIVHCVYNSMGREQLEAHAWFLSSGICFMCPLLLLIISLCYHKLWLWI